MHCDSLSLPCSNCGIFAFGYCLVINVSLGGTNHLRHMSIFNFWVIKWWKWICSYIEGCKILAVASFNWIQIIRLAQWGKGKLISYYNIVVFDRILVKYSAQPRAAGRGFIWSIHHQARTKFWLFNLTWKRRKSFINKVKTGNDCILLLEFCSQIVWLVIGGSQQNNKLRVQSYLCIIVQKFLNNGQHTNSQG